MEIIAAVVIIAVFALLFAAGDVAASGTETAFTAYFRGWRPDPWPHGVQEEYIERPWGRDPAVGATLRARDDQTQPDPGAATEIVEVFPVSPQAQRAATAVAGSAGAGIVSSRAGAAREALVTQRVGSHRIRARL